LLGQVFKNRSLTVLHIMYKDSMVSNGGLSPSTLSISYLAWLSVFWWLQAHMANSTTIGEALGFHEKIVLSVTGIWKVQQTKQIQDDNIPWC
jgi:hypothetical protein